ncbi:MAG: hypothetical protein V4631_15060 [Pseudomonadota bacterium]
MNRHPRLHREREIDRIRSRLERDHYPRLQMGWIVTLTGFAGLAASFLLLRAGLTSMGLRYFCAMCVAYLSFLLLLWGWLRLRGEAFDVPMVDVANTPAPVVEFAGEAGSFDGGGASGNYDVADVADALSESGGVGDAIGAVGEAGDALPVAVLLLVLGIVFSSFFVIYSAPVLFAELLVDGVLAASLYRRLRGLNPQHWLESALRRTFWPFLMTAVVVTVAGWWMGIYAPEAHSLGEVLRYVPAAVESIPAGS